MLHARPVTVSSRLVRGAAAATFAMRLQPAEPGWVDMALGVPLMSTERAQRELGWTAADLGDRGDRRAGGRHARRCR